MAALASGLFKHFRLLFRNHWKEFNRTWQEAISLRPLPCLCFSGRSEEKQDGCLCLWFAETFSISRLIPLKGIQRNLTGIMISKSSTKFVFFGPIRSNKMAAWPLMRWTFWLLTARTDESNSTKLEGKHDFNVLYKFCDFRADRKNKMVTPASDWLEIAYFFSDTAERNST